MDVSQDASNGGGPYPAPMSLLHPAHIQLYGVDATLNAFSQPPVTASSTDLLPPTSAETPPLTPGGAPPRSSHNADVSLENHDVSARRANLDLQVAGDVLKQRQQQRHPQKPQQRSGFPVGSGAKREKLPSAPPAMSARCQVHPALMKDMGASPGDPVLVLALAEGWLTEATPSPLPLPAPAGTGGGGGGVTAAAALPNPRHTGEAPVGDGAAPGLGDGDEGGGGAAAAAAAASSMEYTSKEPDRGVEGVAYRHRDDGDSGSSGSGGGRGARREMNVKAGRSGESVSGGGDDCGRAVEGGRSSAGVSVGGVSSGRNVPLGDGGGGGDSGAAVGARSYAVGGSVPGAPEELARRQQQVPSPSLKNPGIAVLSASAELRCFLCTIWTNPHLSPTQAAVDGRVNVPLADSDYPSGPISSPSEVTGAVGGPTGRSGAPAGEKSATKGLETAVGGADSITSYFLKAAVSRHRASSAASVPASGEKVNGGGAVVGIIPLHSAHGGLVATAAAAAAAAGGVGGVAAGLWGAPPLAIRVSARVLHPAARARRKTAGVGGSAAFGGSAGKGAPAGAAAGSVRAGGTNRRPASATPISQEIPGRQENPPTISAGNVSPKQYGEEGVEGGESSRSIGTGTRRAPPIRPLPLPPEYTSLVKRSLRHLVVSCGCEVAVPACPGSSIDDAAGRGGPGNANGGRDGGGGGASRRRPADGTALVRIGPFSTVGGGGGSREFSLFGRASLNGVVGSDSGVYRSNGSGSGTVAASPAGALLPAFGSPFSPPRPVMGGGGGARRAGALAALLGGAVCAVGQDLLVLVEGEDDTDAANAILEVSGCRLNWTPGKGGGVGDSGDGGGGRRDGAGQKGETKHEGKKGRGDARKAPMSPTDALVELMLLPMTAAKPCREESTPLEFLLPRGVLLTGPPGVGKTFAVRSAVETVRETVSETGEPLFQVQLTTLNGAEILSLGQWEACEALREAFSAAEVWSRGSPRGGRQGFPGAVGRRCAVIFLDEADGLLARRDRDGDKAGGGDGARALAQLLTLMDGFHKAEGSHVLVFGATNRPADLDPALRRPGRFDRELALPPPDLQGRADILRHHLKGVKVVGGEDVITAVALKCVGYVGADLAALARQAVLLAVRRQGVLLSKSGKHSEAFCAPGDAGLAEESGAAVGADDLAAAMEKVGASSLRGHHVTVPNTPWSDIGGMEEAKAKLRQAVEWPVANKEAFDRMGLTPPRGILLFGPPGCSKTTLVRAAATAAGATFVCLSGADVFSPYLGEAEAAVRQAFVLARNAAPALLFFDEIDAIVCKREGGGKGSANSAESRVLATFLTEMDGVGSLRGDNVIVVGATNRPEAVDRALLRPGRFDQVVYAPLPEEDARRQIFEVHTRKMAMDREDVDFRKLAKVSEGLTGAEIEGVCREAAMSAIREVGFGGEGTGGNIGSGGVGAAKQATVTMRNLLAAATSSAARPGVTKEMIKGYDRFASGLG